MKLKYDKKKKFRILFPVDLLVKEGAEIETDDKDTQKRLKELGFKEVKDKKGR
jgi:invasion protein IalB